MIKDFSKRATTVALAIAGSVAAFGFAGAAPAQAAPECIDVNGTFFIPLKDFLALPDGCIDMDKLYKGYSATLINKDGMELTDASMGTPLYQFLQGNIAISTTVIPGPGTQDVHRLSYQRGASLLAEPLTTYQISYSVEIVDPLLRMFEDVSLGVDVAGQIAGTKTTKYVSALSYGGIDIGSLVSTNGGTVTPIMVPADITKLYVMDEVVITENNAQFNSITNTFTQVPRKPVPEPSAILGILAVAGVGAFARRKS